MGPAKVGVHPLTHEANRVGYICSDLAINLNKALHADFLHLIPCQGILETVSEDDGDWEALSQLVGACGWSGSLGSKGHLSAHHGNSRGPTKS